MQIITYFDETLFVGMFLRYINTEQANILFVASIVSFKNCEHFNICGHAVTNFLVYVSEWAKYIVKLNISTKTVHDIYHRYIVQFY